MCSGVPGPVPLWLRAAWVPSSPIAMILPAALIFGIGSTLPATFIRLFLFYIINLIRLTISETYSLNIFEINKTKGFLFNLENCELIEKLFLSNLSIAFT